VCKLRHSDKRYPKSSIRDDAMVMRNGLRSPNWEQLGLKHGEVDYG
jgi:hypothetical protein